MENVEVNQKLTKEQKQAVGLLSIGTFLEYFDLMLYVHMAVLLNELFFPESDPSTKSLYLALTFCSTYFLRPIGALIFGWLGDNMGRKYTVIITTFMMAISCFVMAILPTYAQIGISSTCIVIICRIVQGMSSMGEVVGASLYLTETIKKPKRYTIVAFLNLFPALGGVFALGIASIATLDYKYDGLRDLWRAAFLIGGVVALVGSIARTVLRETPDFADAKRRVIKRFEEGNRDKKILESNPAWTEKINKMTALAMFGVQCAYPVCFYLAYIHCGNILKNSFGYSVEQIIHQNFFLAIIEIIAILPLIYLCRYFYPIFILKVKLVTFAVFVLICPYLFNNVTNPYHIFLIQSFIMLFVLDDVPASPIFAIYFPVFKRFTSIAVIYALSRAFMYVITSFGLIYLTKYFGNYGLLVIIIPVLIGYTFGLFHFERLEKKSGNYPENTKDLLTQAEENIA